MCSIHPSITLHCPPLVYKCDCIVLHLEESVFLLLIGASLMSAACQQLWMGCTSALVFPQPPPPQSPIVMFSFLTSTLAWFLANNNQKMNEWERGAIAKSYKLVINTLFLFSSSEKKTAFACLHSQVVFAVLKAFRTFHQHKLTDLQPHLCFLRDKGANLSCIWENCWVRSSGHLLTLTSLINPILLPYISYGECMSLPAFPQTLDVAVLQIEDNVG